MSLRRSSVRTVIDSNILRDEAEVATLIASFEATGECVGLPEIALFEMTKDPSHWERTIMGSLRLFSRCPEALVLTDSTQALGMHEEDSGVPTNSIVDLNGNRGFERVLADYAAGGEGALKTFLEAVRKDRPLLDHDGHTAASQATIRDLVKTARPCFSSQERARLERDLAKHERTRFRRFCSDALPLDKHTSAAIRRGVPSVIAERLAAQPSISLMYAIAMGVIALEWTVAGGSESARPDRIANDILDVEYILASFWGGRFLTKDRKARDRFSDLQHVFVKQWPTASDWLLRANCVESVLTKGVESP